MVKRFMGSPDGAAVSRSLDKIPGGLSSGMRMGRRRIGSPNKYCEFSVPTLSAKSKVGTNEIRYLAIEPRAKKGNMR
jgi:hypothetical protein